MNEDDARKLLLELDNIMNEIGVPYFLYAGTLLGAVRDKKFIPIDLDIDIACLEEDFNNKYIELNNKLIECGFDTELIDHRHQRPWNGKVYAIKCRKYNISCDITVMMKKGKYRYNPSHIDLPIFTHTEEYIIPWTTIEFYGRPFNIPQEYDKFLTEFYGDWRIPAKEVWVEYCKWRSAKFPKDDNDWWWVNE